MSAGNSAPPALRALGVTALALPLVAAVALPFLTSGRPAIAPFGAVGFAAAALCFTAALGGARRRRWDLPVAALLGLAAGHLLFAPGLPRGHDVLDHVWGAWAFFHEMRGGALYPRWLHQFGLGMPLLQFYGPLNFYLMLPFAALGLPAYAAFKGALLVAGALAAASMFAVVRRWTGDRRAALAAAAAYAFAPYRLLDTNYRVALGESVAMALLPLCFGTARAAVEQPDRRRLALAALALALVVLVHPPSALMAAVGVALLATFELPLARSSLRRWLARMGAAAAIAGVAVALAGFFVLPFAAEARFTSLERVEQTPGWPRIAEHGLRPAQLLHRGLWTSLRHSWPRGSAADTDASEMPFYCGLALLALLPLGAAVGRLPGEAEAPARRLGTGLAALAIATLALTLTPGAALLARLPFLRELQFGWRFLAVSSFALAALAGLATARLLAWRGARRAGGALSGLVAALLIADGFPTTGAPDWVPPHRGLAHFFRADGACARRWGCWEWDPVPAPYPWRIMGTFMPPTEWGPEVANVTAGHTVFFTPETHARLVEPGEPEDPAAWGVGLIGGSQDPGPTPLPATAYARRLAGPAEGAWDEAGDPRPFRRGRGRIEIDLDGRPGTVVVLEPFFPGWETETAAGWQPAAATREGLLRVPVAAGQSRLRLRFSGWRWDRAGGWVLSALTALALLAPRGPRRRLTAVSSSARARRAPGGAPGSR